jgi:hypothetical protein
MATRGLRARRLSWIPAKFSGLDSNARRRCRSLTCGLTLHDTRVAPDQVNTAVTKGFPSPRPAPPQGRGGEGAPLARMSTAAANCPACTRSARNRPWLVSGSLVGMGRSRSTAQWAGAFDWVGAIGRIYDRDQNCPLDLPGVAHYANDSKTRAGRAWRAPLAASGSVTEKGTPVTDLTERPRCCPCGAPGPAGERSTANNRPAESLRQYPSYMYPSVSDAWTSCPRKRRDVDEQRARSRGSTGAQRVRPDQSSPG